LKVLITGADGFIGRNFRQQLAEVGRFDIATCTRGSTVADLRAALHDAGTVVHLAGVNRPLDSAEFESGNAGFTRLITEAASAERSRSGRPLRVVFASSIQATADNPYGRSKRASEEALLEARARDGLDVIILRLPNVFGKWARPNYNSVVATFCYNVARDLPIRIDDSTVKLRLVHVDDVVTVLLRQLTALQPETAAFAEVEPSYETTVGALAQMIRGFRESRTTLTLGSVGTGLERAMYSTYVSYLPAKDFQYSLPRHGDARGEFVEMLRTSSCGQFSYFTAHPGVTRGGHYHHTKTEKFLVLRGRARFRFRHIQTGETHEVTTDGDQPCVVETIPGWAHDITNVGAETLYVMLWANETFDRARPDTIASPLARESERDK
jgi:UDP-2-acetamido-2,6-beta-L-arabino-hexul-4-ose reductase